MSKRPEENEITPASSEGRRILRALGGAALILAAALGLAFARSRNLIDETLAERLSGAVIGLLLIVTGNAIPKTRDRHAEKNCSPSRTQSLQRFAGWTFVLGGLGYTIAWLAAPIAYAGTVGMVFVAASVLLVAPRMVRCLLHRGTSQPSTGS
jgi:uncharacterized membrane protein